MRNFFAALMLLFATTAYGQGLEKLLAQEDTLPVVDVAVIGPISSNISTVVDAVKRLKKTKNNIVMLIDSPGGGVFAGNGLIREMQAAKAGGVNFECYVDGMAASMAFQILAFCDDRYVMEHSLLLWHPVRINVFAATITPQVAKSLYSELRYISAQLVYDLRKQVKIPKKFFWKHFHAETLHTGRQMVRASRDFDLVKRVPEVGPTTVKTSAGDFKFRKGILYMHPDVVELWMGSRQ